MKNLFLFSLFILILSQPIFSQVSWVQSLGPYGGEVPCVLINSSGHIYVGTQGSGIYKSTDFGNNFY